MSTHNEIVPYRWTELDRLAVLSQLPTAHVTPYGIPSTELNEASTYDVGALVQVPLGATEEAAVVERFFRDGYEWVPLPEDIDPTGLTLVELFAKLYAKDKFRFEHFDPIVVTSLALARDIAILPGEKPLRMIDPSLIPFADLSQVHFDYWGNTRLRFEVVNSVVKQQVWNIGPFKIDFPWVGSNPFLGLLTTLLPAALPAERNGTKLEYVLARKPRQGVPIRAVPRRAGGGVATTLKVVSLPPLHVELDGWEVQTLVPLRPDEWKRGASKVRFRLHISFPASQVRIEILRGNAVYYQETHDGGEFLIPGIHIFSWDGCDDNGVFDSIALKQNDLSIRLIAVDFNGRVGTVSSSIGSSPGTVRWADARMDPKAKLIEVTTYSRFRSFSELEIASLELALPGLPGGSFGSAATKALGLLPKSSLLPVIPGVNKIPEFAKSTGDSDTPPPVGVPGESYSNLFPLPQGAPKFTISGDKLQVKVPVPPLLDLDEEHFVRHKTAIMRGIAKYWSRMGPRAVSIDGELWDVRSIAFQRSKHAISTFLCQALPQALSKLGIGDGTNFGQGFGSRSVNLSTFLEGLPIIAIWSDSETDEYRAKTGAHEVGHTVLRERGNVILSLSHKGTSTLLQQSVSDGPDYVKDTTSEIDLMKYPQSGLRDLREEEWIDRTVACPEDVLGLISMASVNFG